MALNNLVKKTIIIFLILFGLFLAFYLLLDQFFMPFYTRHGQQIQVPDLTNMFYEDAKDTLNRLSLKIVEEDKKFDPSNTYPIGVVMSQNPIPQAKVKKGRRIYVIVSKGEPTLEMPNLVTKSERNAIFSINKLGLISKGIRYEHSDLYQAGVVSSQSIPPGTEIKPGAEIELTVSLGLYPDKFIVPDLIGRNLNDARTIIIKSGLTLGEVNFQIAEDLLPLTVISQSLQPQTEVTQGDTINLLVSKLLPSSEEKNK
ncbi:MAG: PASTA domain-containing protein [Calditrichaeota bacterium]|nr:PASTA domain-containing protein [Calditrichota bacterium]